MIYIGIDCSKATFDVAIPQAKGYQTCKLDNAQEGFGQLLDLLPADSQCIMEAGSQMHSLRSADPRPLFLPIGHFSLSTTNSCLSSKSTSH